MNKYLPLIVILLPILGGLVIPLIKDNHRKARCIYTETLVIVNAILVFWMLFHKETEPLDVMYFTGDLTISFMADGL